MRLTRPLDVNFINRNFFPGEDVSDINKGRCFVWAYIAYRLFKDVQLWGCGTHAFVRYRRKFYDSERPLGVEEWDMLPATYERIKCGCSHCQIPGQRITLTQHQSDTWWGRNAANRGIKWKDLDAKCAQVIKQSTLVSTNSSSLRS